MSTPLPTLRKSASIEATFRITTPMYIGDADQKPTSISPASFKGALRFWWRATTWPLVRARCDSDAAALKRLHKLEGILFGSAADNCRASVGLAIKLSDTLRHAIAPYGDGVKYLQGQGLKNRQCLEPCDFKVKFHINRSLTNPENFDLHNSLLTAITYLGTFGGLGSRSRHGFGSVALQRLVSHGEEIPVADSPLFVRDLLEQAGFQNSRPPFTAFSNLARVDQSATHGNAGSLLNEIGLQLQMYRSWGQNGKVNGEPAERNFQPDHDLALDIINGKTPSLPERAIFGLPHNYFFSSIGKNLEITADNPGRTRRASPLFLHIHQFPDDKGYVAFQVLLPADYLPVDAKLKFAASRNKARTTDFMPAKTEWSVIHTYLDRFSQRTTLLASKTA